MEIGEAGRQSERGRTAGGVVGVERYSGDSRRDGVSRSGLSRCLSHGSRLSGRGLIGSLKGACGSLRDGGDSIVRQRGILRIADMQGGSGLRYIAAMLLAVRDALENRLAEDCCQEKF